MTTPTPTDFVPLPAGAFRCRRYLFDRSWCDEAPAAEPAAPGRPVSDPKPEGWTGRGERRG